MAYALFRAGDAALADLRRPAHRRLLPLAAVHRLNGLAFADIEQPQMSRASTMSTMGQQLAQSIGIGLAAMLLHLLPGTRPRRPRSPPAIIAPAFVDHRGRGADLGAVLPAAAARRRSGASRFARDKMTLFALRTGANGGLLIA